MESVDLNDSGSMILDVAREIIRDHECSVKSPIVISAETQLGTRASHQVALATTRKSACIKHHLFNNS